MDSYYISDSCFLKNKKLYFENESNKIKINKKNWFKYLGEYGWEKLPIDWRRKLDFKEFGILDCGANGDCLFHVISEGFNLYKIFNNSCDPELNLYDISDIRKIAANGINEENYIPIIENYKCDDDFLGLWNPEIVNSREELKNEIIKEGDNFWGDHITLQLIQEYLHFNVIIMNNDVDIQHLACDLNKYDKTMIIYYIDNCHFQLIGHFDGNIIKTLFTKDEIPECLISLCK